MSYYDSELAWAREILEDALHCARLTGFNQPTLDGFASGVPLRRSECAGRMRR
jgi:hypothetical protein